MRSPNDVVKGRIVGYDEKRGELLIRAPYPDWPTYARRGYKECNLQMIDSRPLSDKQRNTCYMLLRDIADFCGEGMSVTKEYMKIKFLAEDLQETADTLFSLSNAPMSLVCAFQRFLVRFILEWDIPTNKPLIEFVDDINEYVYACMINKKCAVCGKRAELHHVERVGMGRNRDEIVHIGMEALPLCRDHHTEAHTVPDEDFFSKYHLDGGIVIDKTIAKIYKLKG